MVIKALFPWQQFNWYLQTIELVDTMEDEEAYYGKPINLKCCRRMHNFGVLRYPKYAWIAIES